MLRKGSRIEVAKKVSGRDWYRVTRGGEPPGFIYTPRIEPLALRRSIEAAPTATVPALPRIRCPPSVGINVRYHRKWPSRRSPLRLGVIIDVMGCPPPAERQRRCKTSREMFGNFTFHITSAPTVDCNLPIGGETFGEAIGGLIKIAGYLEGHSFIFSYFRSIEMPQRPCPYIEFNGKWPTAGTVRQHYGAPATVRPHLEIRVSIFYEMILLLGKFAADTPRQKEISAAPPAVLDRFAPEIASGGVPDSSDNVDAKEAKAG